MLKTAIGDVCDGEYRYWRSSEEQSIAYCSWDCGITCS